MKPRYVVSVSLFVLLGSAAVATATTISPGNLQGWGPQNVTGGGTVAITSTYPRTSLGSLQFTGSSGSSKADFELDNLNPGGFGKVADITAVGYEFYRNSSSTNPAVQAPALRLGVYDPVSNKTSLLIFEPAYNGYTSVVPVDSWVTLDALNGNWWQRAFGSPSCSYEVYDITLQEWATNLNNGSPMPPYLGCTPNPVGPQAWVYAINVGVGSGWNGVYDMAVDNVTLGFNGVSTTYNFEIDIVVPTTTKTWGMIKTIYR